MRSTVQKPVNRAAGSPLGRGLRLMYKNFQGCTLGAVSAGYSEKGGGVLERKYWDLPGQRLDAGGVGRILNELQEREVRQRSAFGG